MEKIYKENIKRAVSNEWLYMNENNIKCMSVSTIVPLRITNSEDGHTVHLDLLARKEVTNELIIIRSSYKCKTSDDVDFLTSSILSTSILMDEISLAVFLKDLKVYESNLEIYYNEDLKKHILVCDPEDLVIDDARVYSILYLDKYMDMGCPDNSNLYYQSLLMSMSTDQYLGRILLEMPIERINISATHIEGLVILSFEVTTDGEEYIPVRVLQSVPQKMYNKVKKKSTTEPEQVYYHESSLYSPSYCIPFTTENTEAESYLWRISDMKTDKYYDIRMSTPLYDIVEKIILAM